MLYNLCRYVGCPHPDWLAETLTAEQLMGWHNFEKEYGFRDDWHYAALMQTVSSPYSKRPIKLRDCMLFYDPAPIGQDELKKVIARIKAT